MKGCVYMKITGITKNGANFTLRIERDKIKTLNNIINYNVWGSTLEYEGDTGEDDSCWGFVGDDWANSGLTDNLPAEVLESEALLKAVEEDRYPV